MSDPSGRSAASSSTLDDATRLLLLPASPRRESARTRATARSLSSSHLVSAQMYSEAAVWQSLPSEWPAISPSAPSPQAKPSSKAHGVDTSP